ncbi:hypothetical protein FHW89_003551 [Mucilaginibacter sp. SG564]|nr:hypothetical protein [Mucilaginibacter sp. SG564]
MPLALREQYGIYLKNKIRMVLQEKKGYNAEVLVKKSEKA